MTRLPAFLPRFAMKTVQLNRIDDDVLEDLRTEVALLKQVCGASEPRVGRPPAHHLPPPAPAPSWTTPM